MAVVDVVAQHGWGFGAWDAGIAGGMILPAGFALHCPDRGYFGPVATVAVRPRIVLAHSLGLHLLPPPLSAGAELIAILSGFRQLSRAHAPGSVAGGRAARSRRCWRAWSANQRPYWPIFTPAVECRQTAAGPGPLTSTSLRRDLQLLQESALELAAIPAASAGAHFARPPRPRSARRAGRRTERKLRPNSVLAIVAEAGHALPLTHAEGVLGAR